jgi:hypothetical protein
VSIDGAGSSADPAVLGVKAVGDDALDLLRAACAAAWAWADDQPDPTNLTMQLQLHEVLAACGRFETAAAWAR